MESVILTLYGKAHLPNDILARMTLLTLHPLPSQAQLAAPEDGSGRRGARSPTAACNECV